MFFIVGVLYSLPWFRSEVTLYRWDSIVRFSVNIWVVGELVSGTVVFLRDYENGEKRKGWTLIFLNLARGAGVVASAVHEPQPITPVLCARVGRAVRCVCWKEERWGEGGYDCGKQTYQSISINTSFQRHIFWLLQSCILDKLHIFHPVVEPFPLLFVCL